MLKILKQKDHMYIPFNKPYVTGKELDYISQAYSNFHLSGDGIFTKKCSQWLEEKLNVKKALLTHSCTGALEMAAILANVKPGDEVIMPSYTFVSTANAFVLRGAVPVFVDIRADTLNIDETKIEAAITSRTRAIVPVHYAGVSCEMDVIMGIAKKYNLIVIEDAAQAILSTYKNRQLGSIGHMGCLSFHETKNIISGEGGALLINDSELIHRAEIIREKGTDRSQFFRGEIDKYTWQDIGSSFLPGEITAAFLWAQFEVANDLVAQRLEIWKNYHTLFYDLEMLCVLRRPHIPDVCQHNGHMYYVLLDEKFDRQKILSELKRKNIYAISHYVSLHSSPGGRRFGRVNGDLSFTNRLSEQVIRLPFWIGLSCLQQNQIKNYFLHVMIQRMPNGY